MLARIQTSLLEPVACSLSTSRRLQAGVFLAQLGHQTVHLMAVEAGDLADFLVAQPRLAAAGALHEDAEYTGLGGFPVDAPASFTLTVFCQAVVQLRAHAPVR